MLCACVWCRPEPGNGASLEGENYSKASGSVDSLEALGKVEVLQIDQPALIQPTEVVVNDAVFVETAEEPRLTPRGMWGFHQGTIHRPRLT